jgi:hypothetical protein
VGKEFPVLHFSFQVAKMPGYLFNAAGVTYQQNMMGQLFGPDSQMKNASVGIDD